MKKGVKKVERTVEVPEGVEVTLGEGFFTVKGPKGELRRGFPSYVDVVKDGSKVTFSVLGDRQRTAIVGTMSVHLRNMIAGVTRGYEGRMKVVHSHFPMKASAEGRVLVIQNFLGERNPRRAEASGNAEINIQKDDIIITGIDKEAVGQTMANIELATRVKGFDRRVFQDGIYIVQKPVPVQEEGRTAESGQSETKEEEVRQPEEKRSEKPAEEKQDENKPLEGDKEENKPEEAKEEEK